MLFHDFGDAGSRYVTPMSCDFADDLRSPEKTTVDPVEGSPMRGEPER